MKVSYIRVGEHEENQRIDNFLFKKFKNVPKSFLYRILRKGEVRVNKKRIKPEYRLELGDEIRLPPMQVDDKATPTAIATGKQQRILASILFENDDFIVLNKPAGLAVHAGTGDHAGVIEALRAAWPNMPFLELVHRLDKDTSGCLLVAKSRKILLLLQKLFKEGEINKRYLTLVHGQWPRSLKEVTMNLERGALGAGQRGVRSSSESGKSSTTIFTIQKTLADFTLLQAQILTGRMHQIRVHTSESGHPVVGDKKYGNWEKDQVLMPNKRKQFMCLHAQSLSFIWPISGQTFTFTAPLPENFAELLENLS